MRSRTTYITKRIFRRLLPVLLMSCMLTAGLCGCGNGKNPLSAEDASNSSLIVGKADENGNMSDPENVAMGRYMETVTDLKEAGSSGYGTGLSRMPNGDLLVLDGNALTLRSVDHGDTWETVPYEWQKEFVANQTYTLSYAVSQDGTAAVIYDRFAETQKKREDGTEFDPGMMLVKPDGTRIPVEVPLSDRESYPYSVWISDSGRIFTTALGGSNLYEVKEDGSCTKYLSLTGNWPDLVQFLGDLMIIGGYGYDVLLYDMAKKTYVTDDVLSDFVKETFGTDGLQGGSDSYIYYFFPGEDGALYLAGKKGLYRHVIGGGAVEQVIDGSLCSLGNPAYGLCGMEALPDNEFAALFTGGRFVRYAYDPAVPTVPGVRLKAYSLEDNSELRLAISNYQDANPNVYVEYEVGMEEGSAITKDDALKKLNTQIMAGEGPDLLLLDDMPIDSYIEKGLLADLSGFADGLSGEDALFPNIVDAFRRDGKIYTLPCSIEIPAITCNKKYMSMLTDLSGIADTVELMREDYPGYDLAGTTSVKGIMKLLVPACAPSWITEQNTIDREKLTEFLTQSKRIYDAQMNGLDEYFLKHYDTLNRSFLSEYGYPYEDFDNFASSINEISILMYDRSSVIGSIRSITDFAESISLLRTEQYNTFETALLPGQCSHTFTASSLAGISTASDYPEQAEALLKILLGKEVGALGETIPVNQAAFEEKLIPNPDFFKSFDEPYMYFGSSDGSGKYASFDVYWPDEEEQDILRNYIKEARVPYIRNKDLEETVYRGGALFVEGKQGLDRILDDIEKSVSLQMAE